VAHDPVAPAAPEHLVAAPAPDDAQGVHPRTEHPQQRRQERQGGEDADEHHERAAQPHRAHGHVGDDQEAEQADDDGEAAEEDGATGGRDRRLHRLGHRVAGGELLAEPADHEERVVDADGEAKQGRHVQREHRDVEDLGEQPEEAQGDGDGHAAADDGQGGGHQRPEDEHEHEDRHGDRVTLRLAQVLAGALLKLRVNGRIARQVGRELCLLERPAQRRHLRLDLLARAVELEHGEHRRAVAGDEARVARGLCGAHAGEAREAGVLHTGESVAHLRLEGRAACREPVAGEDDRQAGRAKAETLLHLPLALLGGGRRIGEAAALELRGDAQAGDKAGDEDGRPEHDDQPAVAIDGPPKRREHQ
jgi:hypothetical protein